MKKNKFFWIIAAVVIAALAMTGCPPDGDDPDPVVPPVTEVELEGITVTPATRTIGLGQSAALSAAPVPADATLGEIEWSSEDEDYVTVDATGRITAVAVTETAVKVIATSKAKPSISGFCSVTVTEEGVPPTAINVNPATHSLAVGTTYTLVATQVPSDAADDIEWSSEDENYVTVETVNGNGVITAVAVTTSAVKVIATSVQNPTISGFSSITVTEAVIPPEPPEPPEGDVTLKLAFIPSTTNPLDTPPTGLPTPVANIYSFENIATGNFATASGFENTYFVYPDRVLTGDFKFKVRVQITDATANSASKGIIVGAFKGAEGAGGFATGGGNMLTTGVNLRSNGYVRNLQSKASEALAAIGLNNAVTNKEEEFIYEVIRDESGIKSTMYISKNGQILTIGNVQFTNNALYSTEGAYIQADTPVYAGITISAVAANVSQIELWDGDLEGTHVYYSGDSQAAPVAVSGITVKEANDKGKLVAGTSYGTVANPAELIVTVEDEGDIEIELEAVIIPDYADEKGAKFYISTEEEHVNDLAGKITVNEHTGEVTITSGNLGSATIEAISDDGEFSYFLTIIVIPAYVPVEDFEITGGAASIMARKRTKLETNIPATVSDPVIVWTTNDTTNTIVKFWDGAAEVDTFTGPTATVIGKVAGDVIITATATTTNDSVDTVKVSTNPKTITVTAFVATIWEWTSGDTMNTGSNNSAVNVGGLSFYKFGGQIAAGVASDNIPANGSDAEIDLVGAMKLTGGGRWCLGLPAPPTYVNGTGGGNGVYVSNAELDLSLKYKITVIYVGNIGANFSLSLNTATGSNGAGPVIGDGTNQGLVYVKNGVTSTASNWNNATLFNVAPPTDSANKLTTLEITVDPAHTTLHSAVAGAFTMEDVIYNQFIQFRCDSTNTLTYITYIKVEYVE